MNRVLPWLLLVALAGCQGSASDQRASSGSTTDAESAAMAGPGSESPPILFAKDVEPEDLFAERAAELKSRFQEQIGPLLVKHCVRCHGEKKIESGIRVDRLDGGLEERWLPLWKGIHRNVVEATMPPEDEPQPSAEERKVLDEWIGEALAVARTRVRDKNGTVRRLSVAQYGHTLRDLLGIDDELVDVLPADSVSADGFLNHGQSMLLSPLLVEAYFDIAEKALDRAIVDEAKKPVIQSFRVELGNQINSKPFKDKLILGALSRLLRNSDFIVSQPIPKKPFGFEPFVMRTKYRFIEGYQGNATVRGWRDYDSIYHNVFACVRGTDGYPKGLASQPGHNGLMLRPAIPSAELFGIESTYGPRANFKISLRQLPDRGRFRVTVRAARVDDGLLLEQATGVRKQAADGVIVVEQPTVDTKAPQTVDIKTAGIYQVDAFRGTGGAADPKVTIDDSKLGDSLIGTWSLDGDTRRLPLEKSPAKVAGKVVGEASFVDSPFGKSIVLDGKTGHIKAPRDDSMKVGVGEFSVAAWIHPTELRQAGIVCRGRYGQQGFVFDMPNNKGVLRIETFKSGNEHNGTVQSRPGVIRKNQWQHVAAVVRRGDMMTRLYVNGFEVAVGKVRRWSLDNPKAALHIGRVEGSQLFKGNIDEVHFYRRALGVPELQALIEPGRKFATAPPDDKPRNLELSLGDRHFTGLLAQPAFLAVRLPAGPLGLAARWGNGLKMGRVVLTRLADDDPLAVRFAAFETRVPRLGVHVGLRRDCGSTLSPVGPAQPVSRTELGDYVFEGAINNFPSPDEEVDNVIYLAGIREIGVRSEFTDGRDMPRLVVRSVQFEGPFFEMWPPKPHRAIFIESENRGETREYAQEVIGAFATRAFRRPVAATELGPFVSVWQQSFETSSDFTASIKDALLVVLTSPQFLFLIENSQTPRPEPLGSYELAAKLSYFLWDAAPDEPLLKSAKDGSLHGSLDEQMQRMLEDPRAWQFLREFTGQWLSLEKLDVLEVDRKRFPRLTRDTRTQLREEPARFLEYLVRKNLSLRNLVRSDFIVANEVVASYYKLADRTESGLRFVPIRHEDKSLGGLLSQAGILAGLSNGRESNPVKRGAWLARKIIAEPPEPPPPNVPDLAEDESGTLTLREKLQRHRNQPGCAKCHSGIDPWGLPLEQFDAAGLFRSDKQHDPNSTLPDKTEVADANALKKYLAEDQIDKVVFSFLKHLATYATGRTLSYNELEFLREQAVELGKNDYRVLDAFRVVIHSPLFLEK